MESETNLKEGLIISKFNPVSLANRISFLCFGIGMLMPWNAMLANMAFYIEIYPNYEPSFTLIVAVSAPIFIV